MTTWTIKFILKITFHYILMYMYDGNPSSQVVCVYKEQYQHRNIWQPPN